MLELEDIVKQDFKADFAAEKNTQICSSMELAKGLAAKLSHQGVQQAGLACKNLGIDHTMGAQGGAEEAPSREEPG